MRSEKTIVIAAAPADSAAMKVKGNARDKDQRGPGAVILIGNRCIRVWFPDAESADPKLLRLCHPEEFHDTSLLPLNSVPVGYHTTRKGNRTVNLFLLPQGSTEYFPCPGFTAHTHIEKDTVRALPGRQQGKMLKNCLIKGSSADSRKCIPPRPDPDTEILSGIRWFAFKWYHPL
jgi:hypothetical protein